MTATTIKLPIMGGCLCGKIRYQITAQAIDSMNCHCRTCQKWVGTAYLAFMWIPADALNITGDYKEFATIAASGNTVYRGFCPECGTALFGRYSRFATVRPVAAATLDNPRLFQPQKDIWVADAQPWDIMNPDLPKYAGNPTRPPKF